jgi:hypothetical protein
LIVLESDGREDLKFAINLGRQDFPRLTPLAGLADDGVIAFVDFQESNQGLREGRLVRLNGDGTLGAAFVIPGNSDFVGVQRSGRILVTTLGEQGQHVLVGYDKNGGPDAGFRRLAFSPGVERGSVQIDSEDRIVVLSRESDGRVVLGRFDPDGALDPGFAAPVLTGRPTWQFIRRDGRIVIGGLEFGGMMQLGINGAATEGTPASVSFHGVYPPDLGDQWVPRFEGTDGKLRGATLLSAGLGALVEWNPDGTLAGRFIRIRAMPYYSCCFGGFLVPQLAPSGVGPLVGYVNTIEGIPCRGLARLLVNPPERDFRVLAPAEISASNGNARLRVARTGPTSETASIHYRTRDGDAIAGREYEETSGVLVFAPLEVSKEVVVPLKADAAISGRRSFDLQLEAPSGGYGVIPTTPVVLVPALSLECRRADPVVLTVRGTLPGATYALESSEDLVSWQRSDPVTALDSSLELAGDQVPAWSRKSMFYRIAR